MIKIRYYILFLSVSCFLEGMNQQAQQNKKNNPNRGVQQAVWFDAAPPYVAPMQAIGYVGYLLMHLLRK